MLNAVVCLSPWLVSAIYTSAPGPPSATTLAAASPPARRVYVNESIEARRALHRLHELESAGHRLEAARGYDRLIAEHGKELIRTDAHHFVNVTDHVNDRLARWPAEGLDAYRSLFNDRAAHELSRLDESAATETLLAIAHRWWLTRPGGQAAWRAAQQLLEAGHFDSAGHLFDRLARLHPDYRASAETAVQAAAAFSRAGKADQAAGAARRARDLGGEVLWAGDKIPVETALARIDQQVKPPDRTRPDWPVFGGDASRNRLGPPVAEPGELFWRCDLYASDNGKLAGNEHGETQVGPTPGLICQPVVASQHVYVQDPTHVWSIGLNSGHIEWVYQSNKNSGDEDRPGPTEATRGCLAPAVAGKRLFAIVAQDEIDHLGQRHRQDRAVLVCIDAREGAQRWRVSASPVNTAPEPGCGPGTFFDGSPLIHEAALYVITRHRWAGFEQCYLTRFDPDTGRRVWQTPLAGASTDAGPGWLGEPSDPAAAGDSIYVQTNLGALACVSAGTGRIRWLTLAGGRQRQRDGTTTRMAGPRPDSPPSFHPVVVAHLPEPHPADRQQPRSACLLTVPAASGDLLIYDAQDGRLIRHLPAGELGWPETVLGPAAGAVYAVGRQVVALDLARGQPRWQADLTEPDADPLDGRPFLTADRLFIPARRALHWMLLDGTGRGRFEWPPAAPKRSSGSLSGNVLAIDDLVLVAGGGRLSSYTRTGGGLTRLEQRVADLPAEAEAHLDLARLALSRPGLLDRGLSAIDAALACAKNQRRPDDLDRPRWADRVTDQVFEVIVDGAKRLTVAHLNYPGAESPDPVYALAWRAEATARDLDRQIRYRLVFADVYRRFGRPADALRLYRQILDNRALRDLSCTRRGRSLPARVAAGRQIAALIERHGRQVYAAYDDAAAAMLEAGIAQRDRDLVREAIQRYPNARTLLNAHVALADIQRQEGQPLAAARILQPALAACRRAPAGSTRPAGPGGDALTNEPALVDRIAEAYFQAGEAAKGLAWLARGARDYPEARLLVQDQSETFASLRRRRLAETPPPRRPRPVIAPPLAPAYRLTFDEPVIILKPRSQPDEPNEPPEDLALIYHHGWIEALAAATGRPQWACPVAAGAAPVWLGSWGEILLFATQNRAWAVERSTGQVPWSLGQEPPAADSPATDPEIFAQPVARTLAETMLINVSRDARASAVRLCDGQVLWQRRLTHKLKGPIAVNDQYLVYVSTIQGRTAFVVLDADTGADVRTFTRKDDRQVYWMRISAHRSLVAVGADWVVAYDPDTGARLWQAGPVQRSRLATIRMGIHRLYLSPREGELAAFSLIDGRQAWRVNAIEQQGVPGGPQPDKTSEAPRAGGCLSGKQETALVLPREAILTTWLDGEEVYVVTTGQISAFEAAGGANRWWAAIPEGFSIDLPVLADRFIVLIGSRAPADGRPRSLQVYFVDRATGRFVEPAACPGWDAGLYADFQDAAVYDRAILIRCGTTLLGLAAAGPQTQPGA